MKKKKETSRSVAIDILCQWKKTEQSIDLIKDEFLGRQEFADSRDKHLAVALVFGVLRQRGYLDWYLSRFSKHPLKKMKTLTLNSLRIAVYQLLFMERIPHSAAINETVKFLKMRRQPKWLQGFANGILRNIARDIDATGSPEEKNHPLKTAPIEAKLSHPDWLIRRWRKRYGEERAEAICQHNNTRAPLNLCVNGRKTNVQSLLEMFQKENIRVEPGVYSPQAISLPEYHGSIKELPGYAAGFFHVQDEVAQLIVYLLGPFNVGDYLDACAGLGGKTAMLAQIIDFDRGDKLVAVEPHKGRVDLLTENLKRLGVHQNIDVFSGDIASYQNDVSCGDRQFLRVLVDAPCSGTGVIRRHPDIRWNRKQEDFKTFQKKQLAILRASAALTAKDGVLVYATCSMEPEENESVIEAFLQKEPQFRLENAGDYLPEEAANLVDQNGFLRSTPGRLSSDGFFAARLLACH